MSNDTSAPPRVNLNNTILLAAQGEDKASGNPPNANAVALAQNRPTNSKNEASSSPRPPPILLPKQLQRGMSAADLTAFLNNASGRETPAPGSAATSFLNNITNTTNANGVVSGSTNVTSNSNNTQSFTQASATVSNRVADAQGDSAPSSAYNFTSSGKGSVVVGLNNSALSSARSTKSNPPKVSSLLKRGGKDKTTTPPTASSPEPLLATGVFVGGASGRVMPGGDGGGIVGGSVAGANSAAYNYSSNGSLAFAPKGSGGNGVQGPSAGNTAQSIVGGAGVGPSNATTAPSVNANNQHLTGLAAPQNVYSFVQACAYKGSMGRLYTRPNGIFFNSAAHTFQIAWRSVEKITSGGHNVGGQFVPILSIKVTHGRSALAEAFAYHDCSAYKNYCRREGGNIADAIMGHMASLSEEGNNNNNLFPSNVPALASVRNNTMSPLPANNFVSPAESHAVGATTSPAAGAALLGNSGTATSKPRDGIEAMIDFLKNELNTNNPSSPPTRGGGADGANTKEEIGNALLNSTTGEMLSETLAGPNQASATTGTGTNEKKNEPTSINPITNQSPTAGSRRDGGGAAAGDEPQTSSPANSTSSHAPNKATDANPTSAADELKKDESNKSFNPQQQQMASIAYSRTISGASLIGPLSTLASLAGTDDGELAPSGTYTFTIQSNTGDAQAVGQRLREQMAEHYKELSMLALEQRKYDVIAVMKGPEAASVVESSSAMMLDFNSRCSQNPPKSLSEFYCRLVESSTAIFISRNRSGIGGGVNGGGGNGSRSVWGPRLQSVAPEVVKRVDDAIILALNASSASMGLSGAATNNSMAGGGFPSNTSFYNTSALAPGLANVSNLAGTYRGGGAGNNATCFASTTSMLNNESRLAETARNAIAQRAREQQKLDPAQFPLLYQTRGAAVAPKPKAGGNPLNSDSWPNMSAQGGDAKSHEGTNSTPSLHTSTMPHPGSTQADAFSDGGVGSAEPVSSPAAGGGEGGLVATLEGLLNGVPYLSDAYSLAKSVFVTVDDSAVKPAAMKLGKFIPKRLVKSKRIRVRSVRVVLLMFLTAVTVYASYTTLSCFCLWCFPPPTPEMARGELKRRQLAAAEKAFGEFMFGMEAQSGGSSSMTPDDPRSESALSAAALMGMKRRHEEQLRQKAKEAEKVAASSSAPSPTSYYKALVEEATKTHAEKLQRVKEREESERKDTMRLIDLLLTAHKEADDPKLSQIANRVAEDAAGEAKKKKATNQGSEGEGGGRGEHNSTSFIPDVSTLSITEDDLAQLGCDEEGRRVALSAVQLSKGLLLSKSDINAAVTRVAMSRMGESLAGAAVSSDPSPDARAPSYYLLHERREYTTAHVSWLNLTNMLALVVLIVAAFTVAAKLSLLPFPQ